MRRQFLLPIRVNAESFWRTHYGRVDLSFVACRFCGELLTADDASSGVCDFCWYGQRLEPIEWMQELKRLGRPKPIYRHGCVWSEHGVACRNPFAPGLQAVEVSR